MTSKTAILLFFQNVSEDASRKQLTPKKNIGVNKLIFNHLNRFVSSVSHSTHLPVFYSSRLISEQKCDFGKQLSNAIQSIFHKGFEKVICLGNDCPALGKVQIIDAAKKLQTTDTVLGPDQRGGAYLIGISKNSYDTNLFESLEWKTDRMFQSYLNKFKTQTITILETIADIHTYQELQTSNTLNYFIKYLFQIIEKSFIKITFFYQFLIKSWLNSYSSLRGPPIF